MSRPSNHPQLSDHACVKAFADRIGDMRLQQHGDTDQRWHYDRDVPVVPVGAGLSFLGFWCLLITVTQCGRLCFGGRKINLSAVFAGHNVGVREVADHVWLISFMHYDLGFFDDQCSRVECAPNPFGAKVLPMSPE